MAISDYRRVSKKRPCDVCGKPDWCSFTKTQSISFCARSTFLADRISPQGWGVYYHFASDFSKLTQQKQRLSVKSIARGRVEDEEIRDIVYRKLIELSPAESNIRIVSGKGGLSERGILNISGHGSLPRKVSGRDILVERIEKELVSRSGSPSSYFKGIPGFWIDRKGRIRLWSEHDISDDLLLIPFSGKDGKIQACQIRFMRPIPNKSGRYLWLSSSGKPQGCGPGSPLHHADPGSRLDKSVLVTEGALKAATAQHFLDDRYVVGNSGVASSHGEIVETARYNPLEIAFDNDSFTNPHVARALAGLVRRRYADQRSFCYDDDIRILTWDRSCKGIDEALLAGHHLKYLTIDQWLECLSAACLEEAKQQLSVV